jgi:hypothetical protein
MAYGMVPRPAASAPARLAGLELPSSAPRSIPYSMAPSLSNSDAKWQLKPKLLTTGTDTSEQELKATCTVENGDRTVETENDSACSFNYLAGWRLHAITLGYI